METKLFEIVKDWPMRKKGLLVLIVPEQCLKERWSPLAVAVHRNYEVLAAFRYPMPERQEFGQSVVIGVRREKESKDWDMPWQNLQWPELPLDAPTPRWTLAPSAGVQLRRSEVSNEILLDAVSRSPLRHALILEALQPEPPLPRPPLPLRAGHNALLLAAGVEVEIDDPKHGKFLVKGSLDRASRKVRTEQKCDDEGNPEAEVDFYRTQYTLKVRALREAGTIESFTSAAPELEESLATEGEEDGQA
jgi:hypothetical protein